jgi:hypothetical protein
MVFIPATRVLQVNMIGTYLGRPFENTIYLKRETAIDDSGWADVVSWVELDLLDNLISGASDQMAYTQLIGVDLTSETAPVYSALFEPPLAGDAGGAALPGSIAACISFVTGGRGKSSRGRNYLCGLTESQVTANLIDTSTLDARVGNYDDFRTGTHKPVDWDWGVLSRYHNKLPRSAGLFQVITGVKSTSYRVDSMRRRTGRE